jgi:hypothetical protein
MPCDRVRLAIAAGLRLTRDRLRDGAPPDPERPGVTIGTVTDTMHHAWRDGGTAAAAELDIAITRFLATYFPGET